MSDRPCTDCPTCRGNTITDDGHDCPDCEGTGCGVHPFCDTDHEAEMPAWFALKRLADRAGGVQA